MDDPRHDPRSDLRRQGLRAAALTAALFAGGLVTGATVTSVAAEARTDPYASLDTIVRVMGLVERTYVDEVDTDNWGRKGKSLTELWAESQSPADNK